MKDINKKSRTFCYCGQSGETEEAADSPPKEKGTLAKNATCDQNHKMKLSFCDGERWQRNLST
ncbi:hypothetical protein TNCV_2524331 [Trichonephila clavipes]|nr:hypothetical protein TNCV_2524331 [Trichonephila clavipes]